LWFKASLGKEFRRPYLDITQHKTGLAAWLKCKGTCLASIGLGSHKISGGCEDKGFHLESFSQRF
jgi:hypothetical protein